MNDVAAALHERLHNGLRCPEEGLPDHKVVLWCSLAERAVQLDEVARRLLAREVAALVTDLDAFAGGYTEAVRDAVGVLVDPDASQDCIGEDGNHQIIGACRLPAGHDGGHALWSTILDE